MGQQASCCTRRDDEQSPESERKAPMPADPGHTDATPDLPDDNRKSGRRDKQDAAPGAESSRKEQKEGPLMQLMQNVKGDEWKVVNQAYLNVRAAPDFKAKVLCTKQPGEVVRGAIHLGGRWLKLSEEPGFIITSRQVPSQQAGTRNDLSVPLLAADQEKDQDCVLCKLERGELSSVDKAAYSVISSDSEDNATTRTTVRIIGGIAVVGACTAVASTFYIHPALG